jgi:hypothetical protein
MRVFQSAFELLFVIRALLIHLYRSEHFAEMPSTSQLSLKTAELVVVKPHGQLVSVSSTLYSASTSDLSTSLSGRGL